jgi:hypothetical protein
MQMFYWYMDNIDNAYTSTDNAYTSTNNRWTHMHAGLRASF